MLRTGVQQIEAHNQNKKNKSKRDRDRDRDKQRDANTPGGSTGSTKVLPKMGYGKAADYWSLGIMIYEMLGGSPTFRGTDLRHTYQRILYADLEFVPADR